MDIPVETLIAISLLTPMDDPYTVDCRWGAPLILWGSPGIGKSDRVRTASHAVGLEVGELFLSTAQPEDIGGIPIPNGKGGVTTHFAHPGVQNLIECKKGVIFVDELTCARPAVQGAGLSLVRDRILANQHLPGGVRIVAAANPPEEAAGGWPLALPMANRLMHFDMPKPSPDEWASWRMGNATAEVISAAEGEDEIRKHWSDKFPLYQGLFAGYIKSVGPDKLLAIPRDGHRDRGRAWPSPRTWDMATNVAATCDALGRKELQIEFVAACVGAGPAAEWAEWVSKANMPDPEAMLKDGWTPDKRRLDICFAAYGRAIAWTLARPDKDERTKWAIRAWVLLTDAWKKHSMLDAACAAAVPLMRAGFTTKHSQPIDAVSREIIAKFGDKIGFFVRRPGGP
jgi:AAA domain (dynein-related subfamily)